MFTPLTDMVSAALGVLTVVAIVANEPPSPDVVEPDNDWATMEEQNKDFEKCIDPNKKPSVPDDNPVPASNKKPRGKRFRVADAEKYFSLARISG